MDNTTPCQPIGVDGQYLGACARPGGLFTGLNNSRNLRSDELEGRQCTKCGVQKPADEFGLRVGARKDGTRALYSTCKLCASIEMKAHYDKHREYRSEQSREYRKMNVDRYKAYDSSPQRMQKRISRTRQETCRVCGVVGGAEAFFSRTSWKDTCNVCRKAERVEKSKKSNRARAVEIAEQRRIDDQNPKTCVACGYVGKQAEFYSSRVLQDECKTCRWDARNAKISEGHAERLKAIPLPESKRCTGCGETKPADQFRRSTARVKGETLVPRCKSCEVLKRVEERRAKTPEQLREEHKAQAAASKLRNAPKVAARAAARAQKRAETMVRTEKACSTCHEVKSLEFFTPNKRSLDGHGGMCKACQAAEASRRRALDPEGYLAKMRARNAKNPEKAKSKQASRKAMMQHPQWADRPDIQAVFAEAEFMTKSTGSPYAVDHIWPLQNQRVCGLHVAANLRVVPRRLNAKKLNKLPGFLRDQLWDPDGPDVFHEQELLQEPQHA